jgi:hypothetical protein
MNRLPPGFRHSITTTPVSRHGESMHRSPAKRAIPRTDSGGLPLPACRATSGNTPQPPIPNIRLRNSTQTAKYATGHLPGPLRPFFPMTSGSRSARGAGTVPAAGTLVPTATQTRRTTGRLNASTATNTTRRAQTTYMRGGADISTSARRVSDAIRRDNGRNRIMIKPFLFAAALLLAALSACAAGEQRSIRCRVTYFTSAQIYFDGGSEEGLSVGDTLEIARGDTSVGSAVITAISSHSSVSRDRKSVV